MLNAHILKYTSEEEGGLAAGHHRSLASVGEGE